MMATPYVPDFDHFSGRGAKNVMPLYLDTGSAHPNLPSELQKVLGVVLGDSVDTVTIAAYVYGLTSTPAFQKRFDRILTKNSAPIHLPLTADLNLFQRVSVLGRRLLSLHTWGERLDGPIVGAADLNEFVVTEPSNYPEKFAWDPVAESVRFGDGIVTGVSKEIWDFSVSGLQVVKSWFGYRMKKRSGKSSSPLDEIRPETWVFSDDLRLMLATVRETLRLEPESAALLEEVLAGPLILAHDLPFPSDAETKPRRH
jgi:hypothetical protein